MAQYIKQGNIFGRIGTGLGKGLAEQLPKEMEHNRLTQDLKNFEQDSQNLNPVELIARASSIRGVTPQMIQSLTEAAKLNQKRNAYRNPAQAQAQEPVQNIPASAISPEQYRGQKTEQAANYRDFDRIFPNPQTQGQGPTNQQNAPQGAQGIGRTNGLARAPQREFNPTYNVPNSLQQAGNANQQAASQIEGNGRIAQRNAPPNIERLPPSVNENTINPNALSRLPWSPQMRDDRVIYYGDKGFNLPDAEKLAADDEARDRGEPEVIQQRQRESMERTTTARNEMQRQLDLKLQKEGPAQQKDVTGEMKNNVERKMQEHLRLFPQISIEDAANTYSNMILDVAKRKNDFEKTASTTGVEAIGKGREILNDLKSYSKAFSNSGNSEEYHKMLQRNQDDPNGPGFGMSAQGAATIAFDVNKNSRVKSYVESYSPHNMKLTNFGQMPDQKKIEANSRKAAHEITKLMSDDDSLLSIATALKNKDPNFNQSDFFDEIIENQDELGLNERQKREITNRNKDWTPTWGDILILPWFGSRK